MESKETQKYIYHRSIYIIIVIICTVITSSFMLCNAKNMNKKCKSSNSVSKVRTASGKTPRVIQKTENNTDSSDKTVTASSCSVLSTFSFYYPSIGRITSTFGSRWGRRHDGIDIAASQGTPIHASADGVVIYAGWESGYGNLVKINHSNQIQTRYGHCSRILVRVGQHVKKGDIIARVGSTGHSTGPHVHFEIRLNGTAKNPLDYLKKN